MSNLLPGLFLALLPFASIIASAQNSSPQFTQKQINTMVSTAVNTEIKAAKNDHSTFMYHDHDKQPQNDKYTIVVQTGSHGAIDRVTKLNGKAIPISKQKSKIENYVNSPSLQKKKRQADKNDAKQTRQLLKMIPNAFQWSVEKVTSKQVTLKYKPDPNFNPPSMEDRVFSAMAGTMIVNRDQHRIVVFEGKLIHSVGFFFGLLGHINQGGTFSVRRKQIQPHVWEIVAMHVHINGHVLFFKNINSNEDEIETDWQPAPKNLTLQQAANLAMKQPDWPNTSASSASGSGSSSGNSSSSR